MKHLRALLLLTLLLVGALVVMTGWRAHAASRRTCPAPGAINPMPTPPATTPTACLPAATAPTPEPCPTPLAAQPPLVCQAPTPSCPPTPAPVPEATPPAPVPCPTPSTACPPPTPTPTPTPAPCPNACPPGSPVGNLPVPAVTSRTLTATNGMEMGEVWIGNTMALRISSSAGGYTAGQRAAIVAGRLRNALCQGRTWQDVIACRVGSQPVLLIGSTLLVTIDRQTAIAYNTTPVRLANIWRANMQSMLRTASVAGVPTASATGSSPGPVARAFEVGAKLAPASAVFASNGSFPSWTNSSDKLVPVVSLGTPGVRLGFAQVRGPRTRVNDVAAVLQLDLVFERVARARVFVPSTSLTSLDRVQGVAVTGLLQYSVFRF